MIQVRSTVILICLCLALAPYSRAQVRPPKDFKFGSVDEKLLEEVETVDSLYEKKGLVFNDPELETHLNELIRPISESAGNPEKVRWKLKVLRDPSVNAFAMPNGSIYVHTGLLALLENDDQLAGVLAHEITHVSNRHTYLHNRSTRKKVLALNLLAGVTAFAPVNVGWGAALNVMSAVTQGALVASIFGYGRELEQEADVFAINRLPTGGYDPEEFVKTFKLLDEKLEAEPVATFYRSHPKLEERISYTTAMLKGKTPDQRTERPAAKPYLSLVQNAVRYNVQADIDSRRFRTAVTRAQRLVDFDSSNPENTFLLAEAYRSLGARTNVPSEKDLTSQGKSDERKRFIKQTVEEEEKNLLARPDGPKVRQGNQEKARELYEKIQTTDVSFPKSYRGLGMLREEQGKASEAVSAYRTYLELLPEAPDALRIRRRIELLGKTLQRSTGQN